MKALFILLFYYCFFPILFTQIVSWPSGYKDKINNEVNKSFLISYNNGIFTFDTNFVLNVSFEATVASFSDSLSGKSIFFTNGCKIFNSTGAEMKNGDQINHGNLADQVCDKYGYLLDHSTTIIDYPGHPKTYVLIHMKAEDKHESYYSITDLLYSVIDLNKESGKGEVMKKNIEIYKGDLIPFAFTKHANGRDWWLITAERLNNTYLIYLIEPSGIRFVKSQNIGTEFNIQECSPDQRILISPDGLQCARYSRCGIQFFNFDRCDGTLYSNRYLPYSNNDLPGGDIAFSKNGYFLFVTNWNKLIRISIRDIGIKVIPYIVKPIKSLNPINQICLLPDGNLLINIPNSDEHMHLVIDAENENDFGIAFNAAILPYKIMRTMPYQLVSDPGRLEGTNCDSLKTKVNQFGSYTPFMIYPVPTNDFLIISNKYQINIIEAIIYNINGTRMIMPRLLNANTIIDVVNLSPGTYYLNLKTTSGSFNLKWVKL